MKKCCYTCEHYTPTYFGVYKGEVGDGKCGYDDLCVASDDCCAHYLQLSPLVVSPCSDDDDIPF